MIIVAAGASQALVTRIGVRSVLITGMVLLVAGLVWFSQVSVHGSYAADLAPGFILAGIGLGFSFVPVQIASLIGVTHDEAGIASGLINTSQQVGGALGVAVLSTITFTRSTRTWATTGTTWRWSPTRSWTASTWPSWSAPGWR